MNIPLQGKILVLAHNFKIFINGDCNKKTDAKNNCLPSISFPFPSAIHNCYFSISALLYNFTTFTALQQRNSYFDFNFYRRFL